MGITPPWAENNTTGLKYFSDCIVTVYMQNMLLLCETGSTNLTDPPSNLV